VAARRIGEFLVAVAVLAGAALIFLSEEVPPVLGRGSAAPDFSLPTLSSSSPISLSEYKGDVVLVNFWATWCKPCEEEMPAMERLYQALHEEGFQMIAVSVDEDRAEVETFQQQMALSFPIAMDPERAVARAYQTMGFPESILVGRDGSVIERYVGPRDWDASAYKSRIRALLSQPAAG